MDSIKYILKKDKFNKNTILYSEKPGERNQMFMNLLKSKLGENPPDSILVTVENNNSPLTLTPEVNYDKKPSTKLSGSKNLLCADCESIIPPSVYYCIHCGLKV